MKLFRRKTGRGAFVQEAEVLPEAPEEQDNIGGDAPDVDIAELLDMLPDDDTTAPANPGLASAGRLAGDVASLPRRRRIWDMEVDPPEASRSKADAQSQREQLAPTGESVPATSAEDVALARAQIAQFSQAGFAPGPQASVGGRAKTRLLGFQSATLTGRDLFADTAASNARAGQRYPVGWVVVIGGPGRGACFTLTTGVASIGRASDQTIALDFGDGSISRENHASIAYDDEANRFYLGQGGKSNIVRLNGRPVLSTEDLADGDTIRIGETELRFVAFCGEGFEWAVEETVEEGPHVAAE